MTDNFLSVKEAADILRKNILDACFDSEDIELLISAVRREERERAVKSIDAFFTRFPLSCDFDGLKKKILEGE